MPAPAVEVLVDSVSGETRQVELRLVPARAGDDLTLHLPESVEKASVRVDGEPLSESRWPWWHGVTSIRTRVGGVTVAFEAPSGEAIEAYLVGETHGMPGDFAGISGERDAVARQVHGGDRVVAWRRVTIARWVGAS